MDVGWRRGSVPAHASLIVMAFLFATTSTWALALVSPRTVRAALPGAIGLIAYEVGTSADTQIWTIRADGTGARELTTDGHNYQPTWSPDGSKILFVSDRDGNLELYTMDPDGANQTRMT